MDAAPDAPRILIVDDNDLLVGSWTRSLQRAGYSVTPAYSLGQARAYVERWTELWADFIILDLQLPDGDGASLLPTLDRLSPRPSVAVITAHLDFDRALDLHGRCELCAPKPDSEAAILDVAAKLRTLRGSTQDFGAAVEHFAALHKLSRREAALVIYAVTDPTTDAPAALQCSANTVKTYWTRIFDKTGLRSQREVVHAVWHTFTSPRPPAVPPRKG
jgi:DNA-binding NarL/FixJ family response regulator